MNPYQIVDQFEKTIAEYAGSKYAVAVESGTAAIFLSLLYMAETYGYLDEIRLPKYTYPSVPAAVIHAGSIVAWDDYNWKGVYKLFPYDITDGALRFKKNMYQGGLHCLSFHTKKHLPIGRGGMILTNSKEAYEWLKLARFDGRDECSLADQKDIKVLGWNMYMTPDQAIRGLQLFQVIKDKDLPDLDSTKQDYPDLSKFTAFK